MKKVFFTIFLGLSSNTFLFNNQVLAEEFSKTCSRSSPRTVREFAQSGVLPVYTSSSSESLTFRPDIKARPTGSAVLIAKEGTTYYALSAAHVFTSASSSEDGRISTSGKYIVEPRKDIAEPVMLDSVNFSTSLDFEVSNIAKDFVLLSFEFKNKLNLDEKLSPLGSYVFELIDEQEKVYINGWEQEKVGGTEGEDQLSSYFRCLEGNLVNASEATSLFQSSGASLGGQEDKGDIGYRHPENEQPGDSGMSGGSVIYMTDSTETHLVGINRAFHDGISIASILETIQSENPEVYSIIENSNTIVSSPDERVQYRSLLGTNKSYLGIGVAAGGSTSNLKNEQFLAGSIQSRLNLEETPFSLRGNFIVTEESIAVLPFLSYDFGIARNTNLYFGTGYSFLSTKGVKTPVGDQNGIILSLGSEVEIGDSLMLYGDTKFGINTFTNNNSSLSFQVGLGFQF